MPAIRLATQGPAGPSPGPTPCVLAYVACNGPTLWRLSMKSALILPIAAVLAACAAGPAAADLTMDISSSGPALKGERWSRAYVGQGDLRVDLNCEGTDRIPTLILLYH